MKPYYTNGIHYRYPIPESLKKEVKQIICQDKALNRDKVKCHCRFHIKVVNNGFKKHVKVIVKPAKQTYSRQFCPYHYRDFQPVLYIDYQPIVDMMDKVYVPLANNRTAMIWVLNQLRYHPVAGKNREDIMNHFRDLPPELIEIISKYIYPDNRINGRVKIKYKDHYDPYWFPNMPREIYYYQETPAKEYYKPDKKREWGPKKEREWNLLKTIH